MGLSISVHLVSKALSFFFLRVISYILQPVRSRLYWTDGSLGLRGPEPRLWGRNIRYDDFRSRILFGLFNMAFYGNERIILLLAPAVVYRVWYIVQDSRAFGRRGI